MPPVNTPQRSPARPQTPQEHTRPLTPLSYLSSPAPDLASTLHTRSQAADEADEANVNFLRHSLESLDQASDTTIARTSQTNAQRDARRRSFIDAQRDPRRAVGASAEDRQPTSEEQRETSDETRRERLQRVLARLNRLHEPSASSTSAYSNRTPSPNQQSLYDWAPAHDDNGREDSELDAILSELRRQQPDTHPEILRVLSQSQLDDSRRQREANASSTNDMTESAERRNVLRERERRRRQDEWVSLRSRAVLQRARQEGAGSPSATERMLRYVMDRETSGMSEEEERARGSGWFRPSPSRNENSSTAAEQRHWSLPPPTADETRAWEARERERQERADAFRRQYLAAENVPPRLPRISTPPVPAVSHPQPNNSATTFLENALKYLSELRFCSRYEEALSTAIDHSLATKEFFADKHDDFPMDISSLPPLQASSWLQSGAVFEGHQHATTNLTTVTHQSAHHNSRIEQINPNYRSAHSASFDHPPGSTRVHPFDATRPWLSHQPISPSHINLSKDPHDHWPVRVILHSLDPDKMTLQGTMEAYDVPQHPSSLSIISSADRPKAGKKNAPITTYLEGHIIDLRTHSFLTPGPNEGNRKYRRTGPHATTAENSTPYTTLTDIITFPSANPRTDAQNWLKLPPFNNLTHTTSASSEDKVARNLLSKSHLASLQSEYIFMRWKEKCFVHSRHDEPCTDSNRSGDQDRGHGLTISGFYYVSLRRSDGVLEGLYFDPCSTPYQCLRLKGSGSGWGSWEFA